MESDQGSVPKIIGVTPNVTPSVLSNNTLETYEFLNQFTLGKSSFVSKLPKFVVHTSTIPLCTVTDFDWLIKQDDVQAATTSEFHGHKHHVDYDSEEDSICSKRSCMYVNESNNCRSTAHKFRNCPCLSDIVKGELSKRLKPMCFLKFLRNQGASLSRNVSEAETLDFDPKEVMFCPDAVSILSEKYSGPIRDFLVSNRIYATGFEGIKDVESLIKLMLTCYWFRKHMKRYDLPKLMKDRSNIIGFSSFKSCFRQTLHTVNGLLIKKFLCFPKEISSYKTLARQTACIFKSFISEYTDYDGSFLQSEEKIYAETKALFQYCKATFFIEYSCPKRASFLSYEFRNKDLEFFFSAEFRKLKVQISVGFSNLSDYTTSLAWKYRCGLFAQTRMMGYLPRFLAGEVAGRFRATIGRERKEFSNEKKLFLRRMIIKGVNGVIPRNVFRDQDGPIFEVYKSIEMDIKQAASEQTTYADGGRLEDARILVRMAIDNKWIVFKRELDTFKTCDSMVYSQLSDNLAEPIFWISLQVCINFLVKKKVMNKEFYHAFNYVIDGKKEEFEMNPLDCTIVHINEMGKLRTLVKSSSILAWCLSPGSKMAQEVLAMLPEHTAGLKTGNQAWAHTRRLDGETTESDFMYTQEAVKKIFHGFKDWKESTDFIEKIVGIIALETFLLWIGFPNMYKRLILLLLNRPQPVKEARVVMSPNEEGIFEYVRLENFKGVINDGFMMGNQFTKTILHLMHVIELETAKLIMKENDFILIKEKVGLFKETTRHVIPGYFESKEPE